MNVICLVAAIHAHTNKVHKRERENANNHCNNNNKKQNKNIIQFTFKR